MIFGTFEPHGQPECTVPRGTFVPLMSKWHFDPQTRFVCDTRTLVLVFALRFPQEFSIKNDIDPFKRDFYWRYKCTANRGTNVPQCTAVPFKCFDPLPKIVSNTFHRFWEFVNVSWHQITLFRDFGTFEPRVNQSVPHLAVHLYRGCPNDILTHKRGSFVTLGPWF